MKGDAEEWLRIRWEFMREARECKEVFDKIRDIQKCGTYTAILIEEITNNTRNTSHLLEKENVNYIFSEKNRGLGLTEIYSNEKYRIYELNKLQ